MEAVGQHRVPRRGRRLPEAGRPGRRALPHRVPLPERRDAPHRGRAVRGLRRGRSRPLRGRPIVIRTLDLGADKLGCYRARARARPIPCSACAASGSRSRIPTVPHAAPRDPPRQRAGRRPHPVPAGVHARRAAPAARAILRDVAAELAAEGHAIRDRPADRHHGRDAGGGPHGRPPREGGGLLLASEPTT